MILNKKRSKKPYIMISATVIVLAGVYLSVAALNQLPPFANSVDPAPKVGEQKIELEQSDAEKQAIKDLEANPDLKAQNNQNDTPSAPTESDSGKTQVNVLLTNVGISNGTVSASGFVTNLPEEGGTCTYVFTKGASTLSKTAGTLVNPTSTTCETVRFPSSELNGDGVWSVAIRYSSSVAAGESNKKEFTK